MFYRNLTSQDFDYNSCFLCGNVDTNITEEHIFPKWMQHKFSLWNQRLNLPNQSAIQYKNLTIPCCAKCNNESLSLLEKDIQQIINKDTFSFNDEIKIVQWCTKILYATRYRELRLYADLRVKENGYILSPQEFESYSAIHLFLQSIRFKTDFLGPKPWSFFSFKSDDDQFYYKNDLIHLSLFVKLGQQCFFICLEASSFIENGLKELTVYRNVLLNKAQLIEVTAYIFYGASLRLTIPKFDAMFSNGVLSYITMSKIKFLDWNNGDFSLYFRKLLIQTNIINDDHPDIDFSKISYLNRL